MERFGLADADSLKATLVQREKIVQIGRPPNRIDILTSASGVDFEEAWERAISGSLDGLPVRFPDLGWLLKNKRASGRANHRTAVVTAVSVFWAAETAHQDIAGESR
jgi:hypothetical protein